MNDLQKRFTYHNLRLENVKIEQREVEGVLGRNHKNAFNFLENNLYNIRNTGLTEELIRHIHYWLTEGEDANSGYYKRANNSIKGSNLVTTDYTEVPQEVRKWVLNSNSLLISKTQSIEELYYKIAVLHKQFEEIHPFEDGNGRTGRILILAQTLALDIPAVVIPFSKKKDYLSYLTKKDNNLGEMFVQLAKKEEKMQNSYK